MSHAGGLLITGGAGFIGKWLVKRLPAEAELVIVDSLDPQVHRSESEFSPVLQQRARCIKADVRDTEAYAETLVGTDVVVHLASQTGTGQSMYEISRYVQENADGTAKLLEAISKLDRKPRRIVLTSSRAVYGEGACTDGATVQASAGRRLEELQAGKWELYDDSGRELRSLPMQEDHPTHPTSIYGLTKLWQEQLIENFAKTQHIDYAIFRLQNVYGPEQELHNPYTGIIGIFTSLIFQRGAVELFEDGKMTRDFIYVADVAEAIAQGIYSETAIAGIYNVGSGIPTSLAELVQTIATAADKDISIRYSGRFRVGDVRHAVADMSRYCATFRDWQPTPLAEGIASYLQWYAAQNPLSDSALTASFKEMEAKNLLLESK